MSKFSGSKLRTLRLARPDPSRERLALDVGCSYDAIAQWERGRVTPHATNLAALATALGCEIGDLFEPERVPA